MDTGYDFITPEFFNLIFFQQKNIIIFPYLDLKHLHSLEIFAVGYNLVDLDATAIHNIVDLLEHECYNSYSQNPNLFFISNITKAQLEKIIGLDSIHCIINTKEHVESLAENRSRFVFYNKKSKKFLNFSPENEDLSFETSLIKSSQNQSILQDKIIKIKSIATKIFTELNQNTDKKKIIEILSEYDIKYWDKIIQFTEKLYDIEIPKLPRVQISSYLVEDEPSDGYSKEYELIMKLNVNVGKEFVNSLHIYRCKKVNPANLELMELFSPRELYIYLRNHHWEQGIPEEFIQEWVDSYISHYPLSELDHQDFLTIFSTLNISYANIKFPNTLEEQSPSSFNESLKKIKNEMESFDNKADQIIPPIQDFLRFKHWIYNKLDQIETKLKLQK